MYKEDLASSNLQWLLCHKTKFNHILPNVCPDMTLNNLMVKFQ